MSSNYYDYYILAEAAVESDVRADSFKVLGTYTSPADILHYVRFTACIMTVGKRNRNRRLWQKDHISIMMQAPHILDYFSKAGGLPGENGHPIPVTGKLSVERLVTIDPNNMAILIKKWWWEGERMMAEIETLDQGEGTPGNCMMKNIIQGIVPAFSARTMVPQRRNPDGSIDVIAPGRMVTFDRVIGPSCEDAYRDINVPIKNIVTKNEFDTAMESYTEFVMERSEATKNVLNNLTPVMESCNVMQDGTLYATTSEDPNTHYIIPLERNFKREIASFMRNF